MRIQQIVWLNEFVDKIVRKHDVSRSEVEQLFLNKPVFEFAERGHIRGEDLYRAIGQTDGGRYLIVFFIHKPSGQALVISARDATRQERKHYD